MDDNIYLQSCTEERGIAGSDLLYTWTELRTVACPLMAPGLPCPSGRAVACRSPPSPSCHAADGWHAASRAAGRKRRGDKCWGRTGWRRREKNKVIKENVLHPSTIWMSTLSFIPTKELDEQFLTVGVSVWCCLSLTFVLNQHFILFLRHHVFRERDVAKKQMKEDPAAAAHSQWTGGTSVSLSSADTQHHQVWPEFNSDSIQRIRWGCCFSFWVQFCY